MVDRNAINGSVGGNSARRISSFRWPRGIGIDGKRVEGRDTGRIKRGTECTNGTDNLAHTRTGVDYVAESVATANEFGSPVVEATDSR